MPHLLSSIFLLLLLLLLRAPPRRFLRLCHPWNNPKDKMFINVRAGRVYWNDRIYRGTLPVTNGERVYKDISYSRFYIVERPVRRSPGSSVVEAEL